MIRRVDTYTETLVRSPDHWLSFVLTIKQGKFYWEVLFNNFIEQWSEHEWGFIGIVCLIRARQKYAGETCFRTSPGPRIAAFILAEMIICIGKEKKSFNITFTLGIYLISWIQIQFAIISTSKVQFELPTQLAYDWPNPLLAFTEILMV